VHPEDRSGTMSGMDGPRLHIRPSLRKILDYPKFSGRTRLLILETGYFFDRSWAHAAQSLGWECLGVPSAMTGGLGREEIRSLLSAIIEFRPDFILTSNYAGMDVEGVFARFFDDARIPYVSWFTDTPRMILYGRKMHVSPYSIAATWERAYTEHFKGLGFENIVFLPLATDPEHFSGAPAGEFARELAFVGSSMIAQSAEAVASFGDRPEVIEAVARAFEEGRVNRERFALGIEAILEGGLLETLDASERRNVELLVNYEATRRQREGMARALAPLGLEVRGDAHWRDVLDRVNGPVGYFDDLPGYYRSTAVNINTTSLQMSCAVNQRVFDCPAAGGFLLTDHQSDLAEFFDIGSEAVAYDSMEELVELTRRFMRDPAERTAIVGRAQRRILAEHTHAHRLKSLEAFLKERFR
jgi:spore maturation protein CgeB